MPQAVDSRTVSTAGLESSPFPAGLRANEARYVKNRFDHDVTVDPAADATEAVDRIARVLSEERDIVIASPPLEATTSGVAGTIRGSYFVVEGGY